MKSFSLKLFILCLFLGTFSNLVAEGGEKLKFVAWNVYGKINSAHEKVLQELKPDVLLLCEFDKKDGEKKAKALAEKLKLEYQLYEDGGKAAQYPLAFFSNKKIKSITIFGPDQAKSNTQPHIEKKAIEKALLAVELELDSGSCHVFALHAKTASRRSAHEKEAACFVDCIQEQSKHKRTVVMGDFNSRSLLDKEKTTTEDYATTFSTELFIKAGYKDSLREKHPFSEKTFIPTKLPKAKKGTGSNLNKRIDYIFVSEDLGKTIIDSGVSSGYGALVDGSKDNELSDHRPVWCELEL